MKIECFWDQVRIICKQKKITQEVLARFCNIPVSTFKGWIKKNYFPTVVDGYIMAMYLGVSVEYLVTGKEKASKKDVENILLLLRQAEEKIVKIK